MVSGPIKVLYKDLDKELGNAVDINRALGMEVEDTQEETEILIHEKPKEEVKKAEAPVAIVEEKIEEASQKSLPQRQ